MSKATTVKLYSFREVTRVIWWNSTHFPEVTSALYSGQNCETITPAAWVSCLKDFRSVDVKWTSLALSIKNYCVRFTISLNVTPCYSGGIIHKLLKIRYCFYVMSTKLF